VSLGWAIALAVFCFLWGKNLGHNNLAAKIQCRISELNEVIYGRDQLPQVKCDLQQIETKLYRDIKNGTV